MLETEVMFYMKSKIHAKCQSFKRLINQFKAARDGIAAIEFALIAPLMILVYFGVTEISIAVSKTRQVSHAASVVGDLAAQLPAVSSTQMDDIMTAGVAVMGLSTADVTNDRLSIDIQSYGMDDDNNPELLGFARLGPSLSTSFDAGTVHERLLNSESGIIVARVEYRHSPITAEYVEMFTMRETFVLKPRQTPTITFGSGSNILAGCSINGSFIVQGC